MYLLLTKLARDHTWRSFLYGPHYTWSVLSIRPSRLVNKMYNYVCLVLSRNFAQNCPLQLFYWNVCKLNYVSNVYLFIYLFNQIPNYITLHETI